jgi:hypothetical protein
MQSSQQTSGGARVPPSEPYTLDEMQAAVLKMDGTPDGWYGLFAEGDGDQIRELLLSRFGLLEGAACATGIHIGLQMAEARRDG